MLQKITIRGNLAPRIFLLLFLSLSAGCAGSQVQPEAPEGYVEIPNPALTMSPNAPATVWVPRSYVDSGPPRGGELVKRGYESVTGGAKAAPAQAGSAATAPQAGAVTAPQPAAAATAPQVGLVAPGGKPAVLIPRFGLVVAVDGDKVYFNLGRESGLTPGHKLKVYRGGTVIEGLGLAPGETVGTVEFQGYVGTGGGYGLIKQGGQLHINDLVGIE